ncbi:hypothetical protein GCM10009097_05250 [Pigmentiphaga daeguensis]|uniref:Transposase n=1 Tax=Pigmentiphaga daeguensis TaxID=414049 RepID=A0ABN1B8H2_9BURK
MASRSPDYRRGYIAGYRKGYDTGQRKVAEALVDSPVSSKVERLAVAAVEAREKLKAVTSILNRCVPHLPADLSAEAARVIGPTPASKTEGEAPAPPAV